MVVRQPHISVILPTSNRAALLEYALASLADQSTPVEQYEVVVVDDGSTDGTPGVCKRYAALMSLKYVRIANSGISAAKDQGILAAASPILLFFDDDDVADGHLLQHHLETHDENPQENIAVLGYTTWAPTLRLTPVMEYVTEIGQFLFAYRDLEDGQLLDFTYFWGGRSSCKRSLLMRNGKFDRRFPSILEDIELGYRLSRKGLRVKFNRFAVNYMIRPVTFDSFCRRCERQGQALYLLNRLHPDPVIQRYCRIPDPDVWDGGRYTDAEEKWQDVKQTLGERVRRVHAIERLLTTHEQPRERTMLLEELRRLYWWTFNASKIKGYVAAKQRFDEPPADDRYLAKPAVSHHTVPARGRQIAGVSGIMRSIFSRIKDFVGGGGQRDDRAASDRRVVELAATPNPVPAGPGLGTSTLVWSTGDDSPGEIYLSVDQGPEKFFFRSKADVREVPWIQEGKSYEFRLYPAAGRREPLATVTVTRDSKAFLTAEPNPILVGEQPGKTTLTWSTGDGSPGEVRLSVDGRPERLFATAPRSSEEVPWIREGKSYEFRLYPAAGRGEPLATVTVTRSARES
jgi:glycosyltransferase involved in cell wall biosynthesis